jgi:uncharacterized membrane protein
MGDQSPLGTTMTAVNRVVIEIYVSGHCFISDYTHQVVEMIHEEFPQVAVNVIDIDQATNVPDTVFATPTYLLNGRVWSLGNPSVEQVRTSLRG